MRDELIAERDNEASKQAAKAEAENIYQETQQAATTDPMKYRHDKLDDATHLGEPNESSNQIVINNNPSTVERFKTIQKLAPTLMKIRRLKLKPPRTPSLPKSRRIRHPNQNSQQRLYSLVRWIP